MTLFVHGPDDNLFLSSKHVVFYIIKLVELDVNVFIVILNTQQAHRDAYHKIYCNKYYHGEQYEKPCILCSRFWFEKFSVYEVM